MRRWMIATGLVAALASPLSATEIGDQLAQRLYDGTLAEIDAQALERCDQMHTDACFTKGMIELIGAYEDLAQAMYRHGATSPNSSALDLLFGMGGTSDAAASGNPNPEPLTYEGLRTILDDFSRNLTSAGSFFERAEVGTDFVIPIDPFRVRIDLDGNGTAGEGETLALLLADYNAMLDDTGIEPLGSGKIKSKPPTAPDMTIGFDNADAVWFAGYTNVVAAPVELLLAHDFSQFYDAYLHRVFPKAGLPMQDHSEGGMLFMDPDSDAWIADLIAGIHTIDFPVIDQPRLAGVLERLETITTLSRRNWALILAETDDDRELVPSPRQASLVPGMAVTQDVVDAWMATLDTVDQVLDGQLLVPHWRFEKGFDLKAYFTTASETDLVMLLTGAGALPYLKAGPIADAQSFAAANETLGADWLNYAFWFN